MSWTAIFTDAAGAVLAVCPDARIGPIDLPLSDTEAWTVTVPAGSAAAAALLAAPALPAVECMVKRGARVVAWGPCTDLATDPGGPIEVACRGATAHLDRTLIGPAEMPNELADPGFAEGLDSWDQWATDLLIVGDLVFPTFIDPAGLMTVETSGPGIPTPPIAGLPMVRFRGDLLGSEQGCQLAQDFTIARNPYRDLEVTARAAFFVPSATPFVRTNIDGAIYVSTHPDDASFPGAYFAPLDIGVAPWPEIPIQGRWFDAEASVIVPAGTGDLIVHAAFSPPLMNCFMTLPELIFDTAEQAIASTGPEAIEDLVAHAQDPAFGHLDRNLSVAATPGGPRIDRFWLHAEHISVGAALRELAGQGLAEWRSAYTPAARSIIAAAELGSLIHDARVVASSTGSPSGARIIRWSSSWSRGSDVVIAQLGAGGAELAADAGLGIGWEEILPAPDHVPRWRLPRWAETQVAVAAEPTTLEIEWPPGSPWATGAALPGDRIDAVVDLAGAARLSGRWRAIRVRLDPETDRAAVSLAPIDVEVAPL